MSGVTCPACGETERLRGRRASDARPGEGSEHPGIEVECEACGHRWPRGAPRCRSCGREGGVEVTQQMTRHPRGTLLAVTGHRRVRLCPDCDAAVLRAATERHRPAPEGYVSRFGYGDRPPPSSGPTGSPSPPERAPAAPRTARRRPDPTPRPGPRRPQPSPSAPRGPTLRQATESFLQEAGTVPDPVVLVLWGAHVGASTRLSALDTEGAAADLAQWVGRTWAKGSAVRREAAVATLVAAVDHWRGHGWLAQDLADGLR